MEEKDLV